MGTFHSDKGELHGITVIVDTKGTKVFIGRCDTITEQGVILLDVDEHEDGAGGRSKKQYIERAARFGTWKKHDRKIVPIAEVASIMRLGEATVEASNLVGSKVNTVVDSSQNSEKFKVVEKSTDGVVELTEAACNEVKRLLTEDDKKGMGLRLGVKGGGCSGLVYKLEFDNKAEGDLVLSYEGFDVYLDRKSTIYLRGVTLDHQKGLSGRGFVFKNPNATNTCGCGESFSV